MATFHLKTGRIGLLIFSIALLLRLLFFGAVLRYNHYDVMAAASIDNYYEISNNIISGHGYSASLSAPFVPDSFRAPLYPIFIASIIYVFGSYWAVIAIQILIGSALPLLGRHLVSKIFSGRLIPTAIGFFLAVEPLSIQLSMMLESETLFITLFLSSLVFLLNYMRKENLINPVRELTRGIRPRVRKMYSNPAASHWVFSNGINLAASAVLLGFAMLTRPVVQYLPLVIVLLLFLYDRRGDVIYRTLRISLFLLIPFIVASPWIYRNYTTFGVPAITASKANNLYGYLVPSSIALEKHISFEEAKSQFFAEEKISSITDVDLGNAKNFERRALRVLAQHTRGLTQSVLVGTFSFFTHDGYLDILQQLGYLKNHRPNMPTVSLLLSSPTKLFSATRELSASPVGIVILGRLFWIAAALLFFAGLWFFYRDFGLSFRLLLAAILVFYFATLTSIVGLAVTARYRAPINVFVFVFALYTLSRQKWRIVKKLRFNFLSW